MIRRTDASRGTHVEHWNALLLFIVVALLAVMRPALAVQHVANRNATARMTVQAKAKPPTFPACSPLPSAAKITINPISLSPNQGDGLIGSSGSVSVAFDCSVQFLNDSNYLDQFTLMTGSLAAFDSNVVPPNNSGIMFTTNVPGIEVQLTAAQNQASNGNNGVNGSPGWVMGTISCYGYTQNWSCNPSNSITVTFTAQLVKTGPVTTGTVSSINLLQFFDQDNYCNDVNCWNFKSSTSSAFGTLTLNPVTVSVTACSVAIDPTVVTLPTISTSALAGIGSTTGKQPFNVQLSCPAGANLSITLATSRPQAGAVGVIAPTAGSGYAQNVGVQLLKSDGATPVPFGTAISEGTTTSGTVNLPFYAQYYQTGASATAGNVAATATYTLTYQ